ncbi:MAG: FAD-dependent oxidoreductase [Armatimonadota bacterium]
MKTHGPTYDVAVVGAGAAGVAAALASAKTGARTLLIERDPFPGGDLISGLPILGTCDSRGNTIVGGVLDELLDACSRLGGYVGCIFDWRTCWGVCVDPEVMRLVIVDALKQHGVELMLGGPVRDVDATEKRVHSLYVAGNGDDSPIEANFVVDCTGDAAVTCLAGGECEKGGPGGELQPVSLIFQMGPVDYGELLRFVRDCPGEAILADNPIIEKSAKKCALALYEDSYPYVALSAEGWLLGSAIQSDEMYPCTAIFMSPTSLSRRELTLNTTRLPNVDATDSRKLSRALPVLVEQVKTCVRFAQEKIPGFEKARLTRVAPRIGVRETRRIIGEHILTTEEVLEARQSPEGIALGGHHVDIHGTGTDQKRIPVTDGGSYGIPYGCLLPRTLENVLVGGRCLSSEREANGSARVMGTCLATGQAAGTAAALCADRDCLNVRNLPVNVLQETLRRDGAVLDAVN